MARRLIAWVTPANWRSAVTAVAALREPGDDVTLLYAIDGEVAEELHGAIAGLLGRGRRTDPGASVERDELELAHTVTTAAAEALGGAAVEVRTGRVEREVVDAAADHDLLVVVRDGDLTRLGPRSLGRHLRFVVDHAPCACLLLWPEGSTQDVRTLPPPPPPPADPPR